MTRSGAGSHGSSTSDAAQIATYERVGAVAVRGLVSQQWIVSLREHVGEILAKAYDPRDRTGLAKIGERPALTADTMWLDNEAFRGFLFESPIGEAAASMMRSQTARLYEDLFIYREAGGTAANRWHQDEPGWPVSGRQLSSVWLSLETVTPDAGAMRFVVGSHRGPMYWPNVSAGATENRGWWTGGPLPDVDADPARYEVVTITTEPGDVIIFHPRAIHTGYGSSPAQARRTFTVRFLGDDVRWFPKQGFYHRWMKDCGLTKGDTLDHPRFPIVWPAST